MAMFIVGEATFITGFADKVGALAVRLSKGNTVLLLVYTMAAVGLLSTVLSNTGTTVVAVPMILGMCIKAKLAPGKVLMPVAFASSLGGTVTLVGTPPNCIINSMLAQTGQTPFGFFEFGLIGIPLLIAGLVYYGLIGHRFLPEGRQMDDDIVTEGQTRRENKMWYSIAIFAFVVFMMASELMPLTTAAILGACLMVIAMSASACFLTPIATPPNTIVLGPGKYSFLDYVKAGWPLQLITLLMCWLLIPMIWPFHP